MVLYIGCSAYLYGRFLYVGLYEPIRSSLNPTVVPFQIFHNMITHSSGCWVSKTKKCFYFFPVWDNTIPVHNYQGLRLQLLFGIPFNTKSRHKPEQIAILSCWEEIDWKPWIWGYQGVVWLGWEIDFLLSSYIPSGVESTAETSTELNVATQRKKNKAYSSTSVQSKTKDQSSQTVNDDHFVLTVKKIMKNMYVINCMHVMYSYWSYFPSQTSLHCAEILIHARL